MTQPLTNQKRILVIDDEEDLRDAVSFQLKAKGFEVLTAEDGLDGFGKLESFKPHLIILDLNMPKMGGIEFYQKICDVSGKPKYPVLVLTARANTRQFFLDCAVEGFMTKPFEINDLVKEAQIIVDKENRKLQRKQDLSLKREINLFVVEPDYDALSRMTTALIQEGFKVSTSTNGTKAIERMMTEVPDVALINLGLTDIPGDLVVERLNRMVKTSDIKFILYLNRNGEHAKALIETMGKKTGVLGCFEYSFTDEILKNIDEMLLKINK